MTKKDWGNTAYCVTYTSYINGHYVNPPQAKITEQKITKIGNKYLYTTDNWTRYEIETGREDKDWGEKDIVFPTNQAAEEYVKRNHIMRMLSEYLSSTGYFVANKLPIEKLEQLLNCFDGETP